MHLASRPIEGIPADVLQEREQQNLYLSALNILVLKLHSVQNLKNKHHLHHDVSRDQAEISSCPGGLSSRALSKVVAGCIVNTSLLNKTYSPPQTLFLYSSEASYTCVITVVTAR